jgi:hypothetical protein
MIRITDIEPSEHGAKPEPARGVAPAKKGRARLEDRRSTIEATKPWEALGMSRRTWYRRRKEKRG